MIAWKQSLIGYEWLIHQIWYLEVGAEETISPKPHLIPNARAHLLFTPPHQNYSYDNGENALIGAGSHLLTASEHLLLLDDYAPLKRIGITFRPECLYILNAASAAHINQCQWFDWLTPLFNREFQQNLWQNTSDPQTLIALIKSHFDQLNITPNQNRAFTVAQKAITTIEISLTEHHISDNLIDIETLAVACSCSRRTLERYFKQVVGMSVKQYLQMMRLEQIVLALYEREQDIDWAAFSHQFGFSDQSHLIRTLKQQLKQTPSKYLKKRDLTIDIYGDFE
ncbi:AraC family transcriptional regulator [Vibrio sinensis]|uniref:AraC family transcriptional regulator n=1 Tax=Vibrio sinensis TaxID=2302434 RepID=A0A3A6R1J9_9VIBR|nr:AraC family transcriptional regulator [Vibrio sinensis]RJX75174.1 AraC family transcriptional regulator [Vibrio sinensis]